MLVKSVNVLLFGAVLGILSACSTPCDGPGRLCAPITSITSVPLAPPAPQSAAPLAEPEPEPSSAQTFAVENPDIIPSGETSVPAPALNRPIRIGLILPLRSDTLGQAAESLRAGFMAGYERERDGFIVNVVETGDSAQNALASYALAVEQNDVVVGPLARSAVTAVAGSALVSKPTIALNHLDGSDSAGDTAPPPQMLVMGLSTEDEARQVAAWASAEQPGAKALILSARQPWQRRTVAAFAAQWERMGLISQSTEMSTLNGNLVDAELAQLRARIQKEPGTLLFVALDGAQVRQLRVALGNGIPIYGTSSINPGTGHGEAGPDLDGVRLLDLPWQVQRDHPAVMTYPRPLQSEEHKTNADMDRLYALGIDAFRVAREIALHPASAFQIDGVTGRLSVNFGQGTASFERIEQCAVYENGALVPLPRPQ